MCGPDIKFHNRILKLAFTWLHSVLKQNNRPTCRNVFSGGRETQQLNNIKQISNGSVFTFYFVCKSSFTSFRIDWLPEKYEHAVAGSPNFLFCIYNIQLGGESLLRFACAEVTQAETNPWQWLAYSCHRNQVTMEQVSPSLKGHSRRQYAEMCWCFPSACQLVRKWFAVCWCRTGKHKCWCKIAITMTQLSIGFQHLFHIYAKKKKNES